MRVPLKSCWQRHLSSLCWWCLCRSASAEEVKEKEEQFKAVAAAYAVLSDDAKRHAYDAELKIKIARRTAATLGRQVATMFAYTHRR